MAANTSNNQINDAIATGRQDSLANGKPEWLGAANAVIDLLVENGDCFSSGEIASYLRTFHPDLVFSVTSSIGEHIRDRFHSMTMPLYVLDDGSSVPVHQVPRTTAGFTRTPAGTEVFVYGPDYQTCMDHEFEVEIPEPGIVTPADPQDAHGLPAKPVQAPTPVQNAVNLTPKAAARALTATVHNDGRLCIARSTVEALLHETQTGLKGGDSMYVVVEDDEAVISLDRDDGAQGYQLSAARGRVLFPHPAHPFTPGDTYTVTVDGDNRRLVVDLSTTV